MRYLGAMLYRTFFLAGLCVSALVACSSSNDDEPLPTTNGVNDVRKACDIRATWKARTTQPCTDCISLASAQRCECSSEDFAGRCNSQQQAKVKEATCEGVDACVGNCEASDCNCVDDCYAGKETCRTLGAAMDGCLAEVCAAHCQ